MIDFTLLKTAYENALNDEVYNHTGITFHLYKELGEAGEMLVRSINDVEHHAYGVFRVNPLNMTAIKVPFCGVITANIEIYFMGEDVANAMKHLDATAQRLNATSTNIGNNFNVTYNCQTCTCGDRMEISAGTGKVYPLRQSISYTIIQYGVSSHDVKVKIDGIEAPVLTFVETRATTPTMMQGNDGVSRTSIDSSAYGIDFTTPMLTTELSDLFQRAIDGFERNIAHGVEIIKGTNTSYHIMTFGQCSSTTNPPQNVGYNIAMVELETNIAKASRITQAKTQTTEGLYANANTSFPIIALFEDGTCVKIPKSGTVVKAKNGSTNKVYEIQQRGSIYYDNSGECLDFDDIYIPSNGTFELLNTWEDLQAIVDDEQFTTYFDIAETSGLGIKVRLRKNASNKPEIDYYVDNVNFVTYKYGDKLIFTNPRTTETTYTINGWGGAEIVSIIFRHLLQQ